MRDSKLLDVATIIEAVGNEPESILELMTIFLDSAPSSITELIRARDAKELRALAFHAHKLKNGIGVFGAKPAVVVASALEESCLAQDQIQAERLAEQLVRLTQALVAELEAYRRANAA